MIILGEALETLRKLEPGSFSGLITDPPYSSGGAFRSDRSQETTNKYTRVEYGGASKLPSFTGDNKDSRSFTSWCAEWLGLSARALRDGAPVLVFTDWRQLPCTSDAMQWAGLIWRGIVPWDKRNARPQKGRFKQQTEFIVWGSKGPMSMDRNAPVLPGLFSYTSPPCTSRVHQTEKPLALMRELVKIVEPGGTILDPFAGSGTTCVAAILEGYACIGIEISPEYAEIAKVREEEAIQTQLSLLLNGPCQP